MAKKAASSSKNCNMAVQGTQELGQDAAKGRCYKGREQEGGGVRSQVVLTTSGQVTQREKSRQKKCLHGQEREREGERGSSRSVSVLKRHFWLLGVWHMKYACCGQAIWHYLLPAVVSSCSFAY